MRRSDGATERRIKIEGGKVTRKIRFKDEEGNDFPKWAETELGDFLEEYVEKIAADSGIDVLTSSRNGLQFQRDYYNDREIPNEGEYKVVPRGYMTYRHMSDDATFKFNINNLVNRGAVSKEYPVFTTRNLDINYLLYVLNFGKDFEEFAILQKQGGTRTRLYFKNLKTFKTFFPSFKEQRRIVEFLNSFDTKISFVRKEIQLLTKYKKGLLQQLFV